MPRYHVYEPADTAMVQRLLIHFDHAKLVKRIFKAMWEKETLPRMLDPNFIEEKHAIDYLRDSFFTSFIIKLKLPEAEVLFKPIRKVYDEIAELLSEYNTEAIIERNFEFAHITVKSLSDKNQFDKKSLEAWRDLIEPKINKWISCFLAETIIYTHGLFIHLDARKGLSVGIQMYPNLPIIQAIRGESGLALYDAEDKGIIPKKQLRSEKIMNTVLTHFVGFRARKLTYPLHPYFIDRLKKLFEKYEGKSFGKISGLEKADFFIVNGKSDKLRVSPNEGLELCLLRE